MACVLPFFAIDGINLGFISSTLPHLIPYTGDSRSDDLKLGVCLFLRGIACIFGAFLGGRLCDKYQMKKIGKAGLILFFVANMAA